MQVGKKNNEKTISNWPPDGSARSDRGMAVGEGCVVGPQRHRLFNGGDRSTAAPSYVHAR